MNIENKYMGAWNIGKCSIGHITLDKLAIPETVKVNLLGEEIIPISYDCYGHPNFTEEQYKLYMFKQEEIKRLIGIYITLEAEISYEECIFDIPRKDFDSVDGIKKSLSSLSKINKMLTDRKRFIKAFPNEKLNEYIIFGRFLLNSYGKFQSIEISTQSLNVSYKDVERLEILKRKNPNLQYTLSYFNIPDEDSICPCCGKKFTIDDLKVSPCVYADGKFYHFSCYENYMKLSLIFKFTKQLMDKVYTYSYQFQLLQEKLKENNPLLPSISLLFNTPDGDIVISQKKNTIYIEWLENYKPFDIHELFQKDEVVISDIHGKRSIHFSNGKAFEYLSKVHDAVSKN